MSDRGDATSEAADQRLRFERLLSDLSAEFVSLPPAEVNDEITDGLRRIVEFLDVDRGALNLFSSDKKRFVTANHWARRGGEYLAPDEARALDDKVPWVIRKMLAGEEIVVENQEAIPEEGADTREYMRLIGSTSALLVPLLVGGDVLGCLVVDTVGEPCQWQPEMVPRLQLAGEVFASALQRKEDWERINDSLDFQKLVGQISARFVNLPADRVDGRIQEALDSLGRQSGFERASLTQRTGDDPTLRLTHLWQAEEAPADIIDPGISINEGFPWMTSEILAGRKVVITNLDEFPPEATAERQHCEVIGMPALVVIPLSIGGRIVGSLGLGSATPESDWPADFVGRMELIGGVFANALERKRKETSLKQAMAEIARLRDRLAAENVYLREEIRDDHNVQNIIGSSDVMRHVLRQVELVAATDSTVLITGKTGTGKELVARAVHALSDRRDRPLVKVSCAALPPTLIESELFGHEKGAFTGATARRLGRFEVADGGTIFLDEIGDMSPDLQVKLLRVLQEGEFERAGSTETRRVDVRVMAATNRDLGEAIEEERFRSDLYYRLAVFPIEVPPLRSRCDDTPTLAWFFIEREAKKLGKEFDAVAEEAMDFMVDYDWPGNVRELENLIERAVVLSPGPTLTMPHFSAPKDRPPSFPARAGGAGGSANEETGAPAASSESISAAGHLTLADAECRHIRAALESCGWKVSGPGGAAAQLGLKESTLRYRMRKHGIVRPE